jgi:N-acetylglutamate synthase-like GNAT family acetyltransferase
MISYTLHKVPEKVFALRHATEADFSAICALIDTVEINPRGLDWRRFIIAVDVEDHLVGSGQVKSHKDGSLELASIAVQPEWRKQGVARAIILKLLEVHPRPVYLVCRGRLGAFYEKFGFVVIINPKEMPSYFFRLNFLVQTFQLLGLINGNLMRIGNIINLGVTHERMLVMRCDH